MTCVADPADEFALKVFLNLTVLNITNDEIITLSALKHSRN